MYRAYKFRLYPNKEQKELINKTFGCSRFVYNYYLDKMKNSKYVTAYTNISDYTNNLEYQYPFLTEIDSIVIRKSLFNLDNAYKKFFKEKVGYPSFKSKFNRNSYNTSAIYKKYKDKQYCNIALDLNKRLIKLPKLKEVSIRGYRNLDKINGRIVNATISREPNGKYYVSVLCETKTIIKKVIPNSIVGIDLGIKKLITISDGQMIDNNKYIQKYEKRIKRKQRELSKKQKGSNNYYKCKKELAVLYSKLKNARRYYLHKITKDITDNYDIITCETLTSKDMIMKKELSKEITDASFAEILRQLQYKSENKGKYFYQINKYYPSSQTCSVCENIQGKYKNLNERIYNCPNCGTTLDRDYNASVNIMFEGLKLYMKSLV